VRIRVFLLAMVGVLCACLPLFAVEDPHFSVGIFAFQDDSASLLQLVEEAGSSYAKEFVIPSAAYRTYYIDKQKKDGEIATLVSISLAYASKSEKDLERARGIPLETNMSIADSLAVTYKQIPYQEGYATLLASYPDARPWFACKEKLDAIIFVKKSKIASNDRLRIYWYDLFSDSTTLIFDQMVVQKVQMEMQDEIGSALLSKTAGPEYGLLIFDQYSSSISIEVNGESLLIKDRQALLLSGEYSVSLGGELYVPKQMTIQILPNSITHVPASLERIEAGDIHLFSPLGKVSWFVDGSLQETSGELSISSSMVPLVIVAQKEGFASKTLQVQKPVNEIEVILQPEWMTRSSLVQEEQKLFYKSLRNTMLFFGLYVASVTLSNTFDKGNPLWQPLQVATSGFALVSTLHTIMNLASYVALAGSGVR